MRVRESGRRVTAGTVVVNWLEPASCPPGTGALLGVITTKALGGAVIRNLARRRMREAFRRLRSSMATPSWVVLIARQSMRDADAARVEADIAAGLRKARLLSVG